MKRFVLSVAALAGLVPGVAAQFDQFTWTLYNPDGFITGMTADEILLGSGSQSDGAIVYYSAFSPVDAFVSVHGATIAQPKGDCGDSVGLYGAENELQTFGDCTNATTSFSVHGHEKLLFGLKVIDGGFAGDVFWSQFVYRPYWVALGGALAGSAGTPALQGFGVLEPGEPMSVDLSSAAPGAPTALVVGFTQADVPFKGGVMVPAPALIITGLATNALGQLHLASTWPTGVPPAFTFLLQAWLVDAGGPQGFAASNAVQATVY